MDMKSPLLPLPQINAENDWNYCMRREMQEIIPGLFLGPYAAAMKSKKLSLLQHGVTHIVCVRQQVEAHFIRPNFPETFQYLVLDIADCYTENIIRFIPQFCDYVDSCLKCGGKTLVHGNAGISRSASLVIAYILEKFAVPYKTAYLFVQQQRFCISPNEGFTQQLVEYEAICKARNMCAIVQEQPTLESGALKRKRQFDEDDCHHGNQSMMS